MIQDAYVLLDDGDRRLLSTFGLSTLQYAVLMLLKQEKGRRLTSLSKRLLCAKSTITRTIDHLESVGLAKRIVDPDDRRAQRVVLTPDGVELRDRACMAHDHSLERRMAVLNEVEQRQLEELLGKLRAGLHAALEVDD